MYSIKQANGNVINVNPLETNGPNNVSTPRNIHKLRPGFNIHQIGGNNTIKIMNDYSGLFIPGIEIEIIDSANNNGSYIVNNTNYDSLQNETNIELTSILVSSIADGKITINAIMVHGDLTFRMNNSFEFELFNAGTDNGTYTVHTFNSYLYNSYTVIPVIEPILGINSPIGTIIYSNEDSRTTLTLPGFGTAHYAEKLLTNLVHLLENFAADTPPELNTNIGDNPFGEPVVGQLWYDTTPGVETFKTYTGSAWESNYNVNDSFIKFTDPQHSILPNTAFHLTANDDDVGVSLKPMLNPASGDSIFRVLDENDTELLRVEYDGSVSTNNNIQLEDGKSLLLSTNGSITSTTNSIVIEGTDDVLLRTNSLLRFTITGNGKLISNTNQYENLLSDDNDIPNKKYVDAIAQGLAIKPAVKAATTADLDAITGNTVIYTDGPDPLKKGVGATLNLGNLTTLDIDDIDSWQLFDGILVKDQANPVENGRYYISTVGDGSTDWILTRCGKCDENHEVPSMFIFVQLGTQNSATGWAAVVGDPLTFQIGDVPIEFSQFSSISNAVLTTETYFDPPWLATLDKSKVGLDQVDNTSDVNKPISNATQTELNNINSDINALLKFDLTLGMQFGIDATHTINEYASFPFVINNAVYKTDNGDMTIDILINGVNVTGLTNLSMSTTQTSTLATANNVVNIGNRITAITSNNSDIQNAAITLNCTRTL